MSTIPFQPTACFAEAPNFNPKRRRRAPAGSLLWRRAMNEDAIAKFGQSLRGALMGRSHPDYDEARKLYNGMIDKRPFLIARCLDAADVIAAVNFGRDNKLPVAIRGGGHNGPGLGGVDDGLVIDLSTMKGVRVDPAKRTVRAGAGCVTGDLDHAAHAFGLAVPFGIVSTTGVAGLTLSGGHGYLSRQYGLASDNLLEADVVLADGSFLTASESENADLLWALRGGGGNFGVVTSFLFRAHPASVVYGGPIIWDVADAPGIMRWYREFQASAPDEFYVWFGLQIVPPGDPFPKEHWGKKMCVLLVSHNGSTADGEKAVDAIRASLPKPIIDWAGPMPSPALQSLFDGLSEGPAMVLERRFRKDIAGRGDRRPPRPGGQAAEPGFRDAPLSDRRRGSSAKKRCDRLELPRRHLVDGHSGRRCRSGEGPVLEAVGAGLLGSGPSVRSRRRLSELHDGRRGRGAPEGDVRGQLSASGGAEEKI